LEVEVVDKIELILFRCNWGHLEVQVVAEGRLLLDLQLLLVDLERLVKVLLEEQDNMFLQVGRREVEVVEQRLLEFRQPLTLLFQMEVLD
jgi:hypothetical protein